MTVQALRRGRPEVLAELLDRYGRDMHAVAYLIVRDRAAAEDIVADSLLAALDHGRSLRDDDALRPWLLRIATNKALRYRQRAARVVGSTIPARTTRSSSQPPDRASRSSSLPSPASRGSVPARSRM
jgi:RNA polymerase sigma-70 factor (ECF subfamily)